MAGSRAPGRFNDFFIEFRVPRYARCSYAGVMFTDLVFIATTLLFFAAAAAYVCACERLR